MHSLILLVMALAPAAGYHPDERGGPWAGTVWGWRIGQSATWQDWHLHASGRWCEHAGCTHERGESEQGLGGYLVSGRWQWDARTRTLHLWEDRRGPDGRPYQCWLRLEGTVHASTRAVRARYCCISATEPGLPVVLYRLPGPLLPERPRGRR